MPKLRSMAGYGIRHFMAPMLVCALLTACGGGGGGNGEPRSTPDANEAPVADAGSDQVVEEGSTVTLDGAGSSDSDGSIATYAWSFLGMEDVTIDGAASANASFVAPDVDAETALQFRLTVTDDDGASDSDDLVVTVTDTGPAEPSTAGQVEVAPAEILIVSLADLGIDGPAAVTAVAIGEQEASAECMSVDLPVAAVVGSTFRVAAPADTGCEQSFTVTVDADAGDPVNVDVVVPTRRPKDFLAHLESEADEPAEDITVTASGLGPGNVLTGEALRLELQADTGVISAERSRGILVDRLGTEVDLADYWDADASQSSLEVDANDVDYVLNQVAGGLITLSLNLVSDDYEFAAAFQAQLIKPHAIVRGEITDYAALNIAADQRPSVALVGISTDIRRVVGVDEQGRFEFQDLVPDTYRITVVDLEQPGVYSIAAPVFETTSVVEVELPYALPVDDSAAQASGSPSVAGQVHYQPAVSGSSAELLVGRAFRDGISPHPARADQPSLQAAPAACEAQGGDVVRYQVASAAEDATQICAIDHLADVDQVLMEITVTSTEYPVYTQNDDNPYDDQWSYSLNVTTDNGPASYAAFGNVNATHRNTGSITTRNCLSRTEGPIRISGSIAAVNIGDSAFPTRVSIQIAEGCDELFVTRAELGTRNAEDYYVGAPRVVATRHRNGRYVSVPIGSPESSWGIPLTVEYTPPEADITALTLTVLQQGTVLMESADLMSQAASTAPGEVVFSDLVVPQFGGLMPFGGQMALSVGLSGTLDGQTVETSGAEVNVEMGGRTNLTPLFLAEETVTGAQRRYGQAIGEEPGDDNWSTYGTIQWLASRSYRFNDVSALHVAQNGPTTYRSVLAHSGHSDGHQIDLRYLDENNAAGDTTADHIESLVDEARVERDAGGGTTTAQDRLVDWVTYNRAAIESEAASARTVYIGGSYIAWALVDGAYDDGVQIDSNLGAWDVPSNVHIAGGHLSHWHISL